MTAEPRHALIPTVLVVEDEDSLATLLQYNLEKEGYGVTVCADGEEALIRIDERQPDLGDERVGGHEPGARKLMVEGVERDQVLAHGRDRLPGTTGRRPA